MLKGEHKDWGKRAGSHIVDGVCIEFLLVLWRYPFDIMLSA